jgi:uncharacterized membrane protein (Fun14 family)
MILPNNLPFFNRDSSSSSGRNGRLENSSSFRRHHRSSSSSSWKALTSPGKGGVLCALTVSLAHPTRAALAGSSSSSNAKKKNAQRQHQKAGELVSLGSVDFCSVFCQEFGVSGIVGVGVGCALKSALKVAAVSFASFFALLKWLEMNDLVDVKWKNVNKLVKKASLVADLNHDGKIDSKDLQHAKMKAVGFFESALPSAGGLLAGMSLGLKL